MIYTSFWNILVVGQLDQVEDSGNHESVDVASKIENLVDRFDSLRTRIRLELEAKPDMTVPTLLDKLTGLPPLLKKEYYDSSIKKEIPRMCRETQINKLFIIHLNPLTSFIDYGLIEYVIKKFGSDALKRDMRSYCSEIKMFMKETTIKQLIDHLPGQAEVPPKFSLIEAKIGENAGEYTLEQLNTIRKRYCSELRLSEIVFHLVAIVESNSFIVRWLVPSALVSDIIVKADRYVGQSFYQEYKITSLTLDGMWLFLSAAEIDALWSRLHVSDTNFKVQFHAMYNQIVYELEMAQVTGLQLSSYIKRSLKCHQSTSNWLSHELLNDKLPVSVIDFRVLAAAIEGFGSHCLKSVMSSYSKYMSTFLKIFTAQQLINLSVVQLQPFEYSIVKCRIKKKPSQYKLGKVFSFRTRFSTVADFSEFCFVMDEVSTEMSGSFTVSWLVSPAFVPNIMKSSRNVGQSFCQEYKITSLTLDGMWLFLSESEIDVMWSKMHVGDTEFNDQFHIMHKQILCEVDRIGRSAATDKLSSYLIDQQSTLQRDVCINISKAFLNSNFPISLIDFRMLTIVIELFGSDCLKRVMESYCRFMSTFVKQSTIEQLIDLLPIQSDSRSSEDFLDIYLPPIQSRVPEHFLDIDMSPIQSRVPEGFLTVTCKIKGEPSKYGLEKLLKFQTRFCSMVNIDKVCFVMGEIRKKMSDSFTVSWHMPSAGLFVVKWHIPSSIALDILKSTNQLDLKQTELFQEMSIPSLQLGGMWLYNYQLIPIGIQLRKRYQQSQGSPSPVEWIPSPTKKIFRLAMIQRERVQRGHTEDMFVQMTIRGRIDDILYAKSPVELEYVFRNTLHGGEIILIEGAPGSGKTTLTVHICQRWGKGELFQQFTVVILVQLRDPAVQRAQTIADLLPVENAEEIAAEIIATNGRGVLWVLDGWDELPPHLQQDSIFCQLIKKMLSECSVIVTSRPISSGDLHPVVSSRIEVLGFTPEEQRQYFTECLKGDTKDLEALLEKIQENPVVQSICYLPLNAAFIVHTFKYRDQSLPNTEYEIYLSVILSCIQHHYDREGRSHDIPGKLASLDDLSKSKVVRKPFQCLCELAYRGVMKNKVTFSSSDLPQRSNTLCLLQAIESFLQSGKSVFYSFLHLSIQEVLSAYYITTKLSDSEQVSQFQQLLNQPRFAAVFQFYAAITKLKSPGIRQIIDRIVQAKSIPLLLSLLRCLHEAQDPALCLYVAERLEYRLDLSGTSLSSLDCLSVGFFLSSVASKHIITLYLAQCQIGDLGVKYLTKNVSTSDYTNLIIINLKGNDVHDEGASHVARILYFIEHLHLDVSENPIGDAGASLILDAVRTTTVLKTLTLMGYSVFSRKVEDNLFAFGRNNSLKKFDVFWNNPADKQTIYPSLQLIASVDKHAKMYAFTNLDIVTKHATKFSMNLASCLSASEELNSFIINWHIPSVPISYLIESANQIGRGYFEMKHIHSLSVGNRWLYNPKLSAFSSTLKEKYQQSQGLLSPVEWIPSPTKNIFRLAMIQRERVQRGHIRDRLVRLTISGRVDDILHAKSPVKIEDIFSNTLVGGENILIEGAPGSGKSTLTVHICQRWGKGELFQQFTVVILVQLRDPAVQRAQTIADVLPVENAEEIAAELMATNGRGVLWVLDGWDELPPHLRQQSIFCQLIKRMLGECSVIVTSRPISSGDLHPVVSSRIEVLGFTPEEQRQYFTERLKGDIKALLALLEKIQENPVVQSICYLPLNAAFIVHTFKYRDQSLPNTEYEIYLSVILSYIQRHYDREGRGHDLPRELASLDDLSRSEAVREPFQCLCELAYRGMIKNKVTFSSSDLPQGSNTLSLFQAIESFLQSGKSVFYNFLHLSIQEVLSAYYITTKLSDSEQVSQFQLLFNQPHFAAVFQFYAAITKLKSPGIRQVIDRIVEAKSKPLLVSLLRCLHEAQDPALCLYVAERLGYRLDLSETSLSPLDCLSVSYFFSSLAGKEISFNLAQCQIGDLGVKWLTKYLSMRNYTDLVTINLKDNDIHYEGASYVAKLFYVIESLHLDVSENPLRDTGASFILEALRMTTTLKSLTLVEYAVFSTRTEDILIALGQNNSLKKFDVIWNNPADKQTTHPSLQLIASVDKHAKTYAFTNLDIVTKEATKFSMNLASCLSASEELNSFIITWHIPSVPISYLIESANQIGRGYFEMKHIHSLSVGNRWLYNPKLSAFGSTLKEKYQQSQGSPSPVEWIPSPTKKIFRLAMIQRERVQRGVIDDRFVQMTISGRVDDILHAKSPVELEHIFRSTLHGGEIILIEGAPGSGKSTLTVHICRRWGKGELFQQFTIVILVQLRDPAVQRALTIADLLPVENAEEIATELIATNGRGILWVLDGWDELPSHLQQDSIFRKLLPPKRSNQNLAEIEKDAVSRTQFYKNRLLYETSIIVTSRPISSGDLHPVISLRIEVLGFTPEEQRQYFTECFKEDTKALEALLEKIQENPLVQSICYLPLNAAFIVHTFKYRDQSLPNTEYEIYLSVILSCIQRHYDREGRVHDLPRKLASLDDVFRSKGVREPFQCLCELAYRGVMENKVTFSSSDLPQGSNTLSLLQAIESFLQSGKSVFYNFLHLSIQEVLSAYYITTKLSNSEQVSQFQQLFNQPRFAAVFQFYAAITKLKNPGIRQVIARIVGAKSKPLLVSLLRCLHEAQDPALCLYVAERLEYRLDLNETSLSPLDCFSVSFFLSTLSCKEISFNLSQCQIGDLGAKCLTKYLSMSSHTDLVTINLKGSDIHDEGAAYIAKLLHFTECLHLDISENPIGDTGASFILKALRTTTTLKSLTLVGYAIFTRWIEDILIALGQNNSLQNFDVFWNNPESKEITHLSLDVMVSIDKHAKMYAFQYLDRVMKKITKLSLNLASCLSASEELDSFIITWRIPSVPIFYLIESAKQIERGYFEMKYIHSLSVGNRWLYNAKLSAFGSTLKQRYEQSQGSPSPVEWIPSPTKKIFRLAMIQRERVQRGHIEDMFVQMTIRGRIDDILHAKSPVELEYVFRNTLHGGEIILIEGAPGSGKSTLTVHLCQRWGKGELFQQFIVVILVQLRDPAVQRAQTIADLLPVENAEEIAAELMATNGRGVLWVLDGWDELPPHLQQDSIFRKLIQRTFNECSVIVTSHPISSGDLHPVVSSRIEVLGFTPKEQRQYFTECLKGDTKALEALLEKIQENPVVQSISYLPLNAAFIVHTFKYRDQSLPSTEYEIYLSVILSCIQRHYDMEGRGHDQPRELASLDDLSRIEAVREPFQCLCELAYRGVMENKVTFSSSDLPQGSNTLSLLQAIESFLQLQSGKSVFYNFLHLSIQEVLSAYYITTKLSVGEQVSQFQQLFNQPRFAAVFQFYASITKLKSPGIRQITDRIVEAKSKPLLMSLLHCLHKAQDPDLCLYVAERLEYELDLSETSLTPLDCLPVSFFLSSFSGKKVTVNLRRCYIGDLGIIKCLTKFLHSSVHYASNVVIDLRDGNLNQEDASYIARMVYFTEHLYLSYNPIGDTGASLISEAVRETVTLKTLILFNCGITITGSEDVSRTLAQNSSLEKLDIGGNKLGDEGISHMAEALKQNKQLKELWIGGGVMTDKGAASLASALTDNNSLKMLHMGGKKGALTEDGFSAIAHSIANKSLFVKLAIPGIFGSATADRLSQEVNKARRRNGLPPIEIEGEYTVCCVDVLYRYQFSVFYTLFA